MNEMESVSIVSSIDLLVQVFGNEMEPYAISLCEKMASTFHRTFGNEIDTEEEEEVEHGCLTVIYSLLRSFDESSKIYSKLENICIPIIVKVLSSDLGCDYLETALQMLTCLLIIVKMK
jgi:hypothetical protein